MYNANYFHHLATGRPKEAYRSRTKHRYGGKSSSPRRDSGECSSSATKICLVNISPHHSNFNAQTKSRSPIVIVCFSYIAFYSIGRWCDSVVFWKEWVLLVKNYRISIHRAGRLGPEEVHQAQRKKEKTKTCYTISCSQVETR